ncbi:MAG: ATP-binding cassette domain-containing protein, partial [Planctomycetota bacterium]
TDINEVISLMVGRKLESNFPKESIAIGAKLLEVRGLGLANKFRNIGFSVQEGEIVGFAGLVGAGRTEVMRALFGLDSFDTGEIRIRDKLVRIRSVKDSLDNRMTMLSEDRRRYGIIPVRSVRENVTISSLHRFIRGGRLRAKEEQDAVLDICTLMSVKTPSLETVIESLSGGNQQKVLLAKWMLSEPDILILDEPTRGIDVGAKYEIYKLMSQLAKERKGLIMVSSELPELIGMCDRIYVMCKGEIAGEVARSGFSQETIMRLATGVERQMEAGS